VTAAGRIIPYHPVGVNQERVRWQVRFYKSITLKWDIMLLRFPVNIMQAGETEL
jgi:hypothetical protein